MPTERVDLWIFWSQPGLLLVKAHPFQVGVLSMSFTFLGLWFFPLKWGS